jgi:hypothetical protein
MESQSSFDAYRMPDAMWEKIRLLLPDYEAAARRQTTERFTMSRGRNFLTTTYGLPIESDSQESCSRQYGTRLFPGMGATGHLRKALANRPRVIRRFGGARLALAVKWTRLFGPRAAPR